MCGIVGMIQYRDHGFDYDSKQALWPMMLLNSMRGAHSTGLFGVQKETKKDVVEWVKRVGPPHGLMSEPESKKFMDRMFSRYHAVIAHGRYATTGKVNAKNAHPFHHGNIVLVHNGSVRNLWNMKVNGESVEKKFEVDSEALTYMFSKVGVKDTLKEVTGALSLIWYDRATRCIHALRNVERPMFLMQRTDIPQIFFSSEMETLEYVINKYPGIKAKEIKTLAPDYLYTFPLGNGNAGRIEREKVRVGSWGYHPVRHMGSRHTNFENYGDMTDLFTPELDRITAASRLQEEEADRSRSTTGGQIVPFVRRPSMTTPIKAGSGEDERARMTEITRFGIKFKVGEWTAFFPQNCEIIGKENKTWYIHGDHPGLRNVSVACHFKGETVPIKEEILLAGEIDQIMSLNEEKANGYTLRVYVKNLSRISHHVQNRILNKEVFDLKAEMERYPAPTGATTAPTLVLKSGAQLSLWRFERLAQDKCAKCNGEIDIPDAPGCLLVNDLSEATAQEKVHGGLICPDCVIHSVVN